MIAEATSAAMPELLIPKDAIGTMSTIGAAEYSPK